MERKKIFWVSEQPTRMQIVRIYMAIQPPLFLLLKTSASMHKFFFFKLQNKSRVDWCLGVNFQICMYVGELLLHPPDLPIRTGRPTAANTLNLPQAAGSDVGIKQLAIKSLLGHKPLEKFTIKRQRDNKDSRRGIILCPDLRK